MRLVIVALLAGGPGVFAQQHSGPSGFAGHPGPVGAPSGAVGIPTGAVGIPRGGGSFGSTPGARLSGSGRRAPLPPPVAHPSHSRGTVVYYPVYYGGYYYGYDPSVNTYAQPAPSNDGDPGYAAPGQSPVVILNQSYRPDVALPVMRDYSNTPLPDGSVQPAPNDDQPTIYLIAMKDHTIFPTVAYWVEGDTLNYVTTEGSPNRASLDLVDREFSRQLNDERHVEFKLPNSNTK